MNNRVVGGGTTSGGDPMAGTSTMPIEGELAARLEQVRAQEAAHTRHRRLVRLERIVLLPVLLAALLAWGNISRAKVVGASMQPTFHTDDTLIVLKTFRWLSPLKVGDVVVLHMKHTQIKGEDIVKRVVFRQNAEGNAPLPATIKTTEGILSTWQLFPELVRGNYSVPRNGLLVLGDNMPHSMDSRELGPISDSEIVGKVI